MPKPSLAAAVPAPLARFVDRGVVAPGAANDDRSDAEGEALLRAALRLFAAHGLGAARRAQGRAEEAFFAGDRDGYRWWLAVTRTLDRTLAVELAARCPAHGAAQAAFLPAC